MGYFISPLLSVFLGVWILHERLHLWQWISVAIAAAGVLIMTVVYGQFPWISLYLASTWAVYGLLRKQSPLSAVEGLTVETAMLSVPALAYVILGMTRGTGAFPSGLGTAGLLIGAGIISGFPLISSI